MRGLLHLIAAIIISAFVLPIGFLYSVGNRILEKLDNYFYSIAYKINVFSTYVCSDFYNDILLKKNSITKFLFGKRNVSISYHIGKNIEYKSLSQVGKIINSILNIIEKDHCIKAVQREDNVK